MTNVQTIPTIGDGLAHSSGAQLEFDAAGNLYVANSGIAVDGQLVQVYSPGGSTKAVTSSDGTFSLEELAAADTGDFDDDGDVDGGDFLAWQRNFGISDGTAARMDGDADGDGNVTATDFAVWRNQFGETPVAASAAVPEPTSLVAFLVTITAPIAAARRRKRMPQ